MSLIGAYGGLLGAAGTFAAAPSINVARSSNGGVATASTWETDYGTFPPAGANNGDRTGIGWGVDGGWSSSIYSVPAWLKIAFSGSKTIKRIDVFTMPDENIPFTHTPTSTCTDYGIEDFEIQYWDGSTWITIETVTGNTLSWRAFTFPEITTTAIRLYITLERLYWARVLELEAWT